MVVKQANITSYKVSDPSEILDRRPVKYIGFTFYLDSSISFWKMSLILPFYTSLTDNI